jgi:hypothetical protein
MMILSKVQENEIFVAIQTKGLDPSDFEWSNRTDKFHLYRRLTHRPTKTFIELTEGPTGGHWATWQPALSNGLRSAAITAWPAMKGMIFQWIDVVKADHEAPDLWGALKAQSAIPRAVAQLDQRRPFTPEELTQLHTGINEIEQHVLTTQPLDPNDQLQIKRRFSYLRDSANRGLQKIDWLNIFVGQIVSMVTEGLLKPSFYGPLMAHAQTALRFVFDFGVKLLQSGG